MNKKYDDTLDLDLETELEKPGPFERHKQAESQSWELYEGFDEWPTRMVLPLGKYKTRLKFVKEIEVPNYERTGKEKKILFTFEVLGVDIPPRHECVVTAMAKFSRGFKSNMFKLVANMSPEGIIPREALRTGADFQEYIEGLVGKEFYCSSCPNKAGTRNDLLRLDAHPVEIRQTTGKPVSAAPTELRDKRVEEGWTNRKQIPDEAPLKEYIEDAKASGHAPIEKKNKKKPTNPEEADDLPPWLDDFKGK